MGKAKRRSLVVAVWLSHFRIYLRLQHAVRLSIFNALMAYNAIIAGSLVSAKENEATLGIRVNTFLTPTVQDEVVEEYNAHLSDFWEFIREEEEAARDSCKYFSD